MLDKQPYKISEIINELRRLQVEMGEDLFVRKLSSVEIDGKNIPTLLNVWPVILQDEKDNPFVAI